jgi:hypothetical protein
MCVGRSGELQAKVVRGPDPSGKMYMQIWNKKKKSELKKSGSYVVRIIQI